MNKKLGLKILDFEEDLCEVEGWLDILAGYTAFHSDNSDEMLNALKLTEILQSKFKNLLEKTEKIIR